MKITFRILMGLLLSVILLWGVILFRFNSLGNSQFVQPALSIHEEVAQADLELGKRIYSVRSGCIDCHGTDLSGAKVMDNSTMGSIYGANITPYNLKSWSDEEVAVAIRYGIHKTNRSLRFMPSFDFEGLSKSDVAALIAYVRSVPSVDKHSRENYFGPMAKTLSSLGQMPVMFPAHIIDSSKPFAEKPAEGATIEFGKYLASSCVGCHGVEYKGGKIPGGDPSWPEASNIRLGDNSTWTEQSFKNVILTGVSPTTKQTLRPPMPIALLKQMNEMEIKALWLYLSTLK